MAREYSFGIEEEYFIACAETRNTTRRKTKIFFDSAKRNLPNIVQHEMLQAQVEVATRPCIRLDDAAAQLLGARDQLAATAAEHDLMIFAAGTHPLAAWTQQRVTGAARYGKLMHDLQMIGARNMLCGMHVHVEVPDPDRRVDIMVRMIPFVPLFLALSTSSPFWQSRRTGLMGYRLAAYNELPRTGLPELFADKADYDRYVATMTASRAIADPSYIWWAIRPSLKHPTLELRVADSCTSVTDALGIAALYRALVRHLDRNGSVNGQMTAASRAVALENKWRAQRYGIHGSFIDEATQSLKGIAHVFDEMVDMLDADIRELGVRDEVTALRSVFQRGTSADTQIALHTEAIGRGLGNTEALADVVDWLALTTRGVTAVLPDPELVH